MRLFQAAILACTALAFTGCATRGAVEIACSEFADPNSTIVFELPQSQLVREIQQESAAINVKLFATSETKDGTEAASDRLTDAIAKALTESLAKKMDEQAPRQLSGRALLLSGGGQWGSFGAGFLHQLYTDQRSAALDYDVITGVSTGGLQSIFVAVGDLPVTEHEKQRFEKFLAAQSGTGFTRPGDTVRYIDLLQMNYSPSAESDIVNRNMKELAVVTGSFAGLKPLKKRIEGALCKNGNPAEGCPLIDALADSGKAVFIGFVRADDGKFIIADAVGLAGLAKSKSPASYERARDCLTGAALASAAMPVTFQQVRVEGRAYLDGGVRQSVFDASAISSFEKARKISQKDGDPAPRPVELNVIRNGPTVLANPPGTEEINDKADAISAAERAQAIVVNELEVGSIASLRLDRPKGPIRLITADGYARAFKERPDGCKKIKEQAMFEPEFMACLRAFGRYKAGRKLGDPPSPWLILSEIQPPSQQDANHQTPTPTQGGNDDK